MKQWWIDLYRKIAHIDDSPQRIALGFGLGVFAGILPGTGPVAAVLLATLVRVNKVSALAGSVLTNTWLSLVIFLVSAKVGARVMNVEWEALSQRSQKLFQDFSWQILWDKTNLEFLLPIFVGYILVGFMCGVVAYLLAMTFLWLRYRDKVKNN